MFYNDDGGNMEKKQKQILHIDVNNAFLSWTAIDRLAQGEKVDIREIKIDRRKPSNERILDFITKAKNPYIFKVNGKLVRIRFSDTDKTADECLTNVLKNLYR